MKREIVPAAVLLGLAVALGGCVSMRELAGFAKVSDPSVNIRSAETRWLLIKNPRYPGVSSEPEYVWVEEDKVPTTVKTLVMGKGSLIAPPEVVAKYGPPPGGGKISPRQGGPYQVTDARKQPPPAATTPARAAGGPANGAALAAATQRGYVVFVDTTRIVIDLAARDGVRPGALVSVRRDKLPIVHPVTGEILGELDDEIGTARVTEIRDKFSVAAIQSLADGSHIQVKDRAVLK
jgi:hypothetical protein